MQKDKRAIIKPEPDQVEEEAAAAVVEAWAEAVPRGSAREAPGAASGPHNRLYILVSPGVP
jgi:hypothetical protein